jgi:hypothetical protein
MNILLKFSEPSFVCACVIRLLCIALFLTALEYVMIIRQFADDGIYSWKMIKLRTARSIRKLSPDMLFNKTGVFTIMALRIGGSIYLFINPISPATVYLLAIVVATSLLLAIRNPIGGDGADQMSAITSIALLITFIFRDPKIAAVSLYFIAAQSIISYVIAGTAKMLSKKWRSGAAVFQIMNTESYGSERIAFYLHRSSPVVSAVLSWNVMLIEGLFFTVLILPYPYCLVFLAWGLFFHAYNAIVMGLNNFFWVFLSTYPAIIYSNIALHHYWGL